MGKCLIWNAKATWGMKIANIQEDLNYIEKKNFHKMMRNIPKC